LNENYARELLELHTLGVDNGYSQFDVTEVARVLTGWSVQRTAEGEYGFFFKREYNDPFPKNILGVRLRGSGGIDDGHAVLAGLARHPNTAQFICWKLVRYLVNDEPPLALVNRAAGVFRSSGGDLKRVYREILLSPEISTPANFRTKFKTPFEYAVSAIRASGAKLDGFGGTLATLSRMGQPVYECEEPTGYYDHAEAWCDPGVMIHRWDFAMKLAAGRLDGASLPKDFYASLAKLEAKDAKEKLIRTIYPDGIDEKTRQILDKESAKMRGAEAQNQRFFGLLLGSPGFQQQ
jgi:uncharacterized protein (DUF1800 family)